MLLAIALGVVLGLGASWLRRSNLSAPAGVAIFVVAALAFMTAVGQEDVWPLAGAMLASAGVVEIATAGKDPQVPATAARTVGVVLVALGIALVAIG